MPGTPLGVRHALLLLPLALISTWLVQRSRVVSEDPTTVLAALRAAHGPTLPTAAAAGVSDRSEVEAFDRESLYEYIDGAADAYLARGFERCAVADFGAETDSGERIEVTAEIYRFASPDGARAQLEAERPATAVALAGLDGAVGDADVVLAAWDRDYVKLVVLTPSPQASATLERIVRAIRGAA